MASWIGAAKERLGRKVLILGHHYQRDEVMRWADARGDSLALARTAASRPEASYIVFCGVHFMAESADILTGPHQKVILPDLNAGCSMADMADLQAAEEAWDELSTVIDVEQLIPVTYINSSAALKAFVASHGGSVCTSSNARAVLSWALGLNGYEARGDKVLFLPDQHLGRNTGIQLGFSLDDMVVWDPRLDLGGMGDTDAKSAKLLLWKGHCSVHQRFSVQHVEAFRTEHPEGLVVVHPECSHDVVTMADLVGSTDFIIRTVEHAKPGTVMAIGTEIHLVNRLANDHPELTIVSLDPLVCPCSTMFRIDAAHLAWVLEGLVEGEVRNLIQVDEPTAAMARVALERMLQIA
ncbi:MAG: quinolinate synthase NadA [Actinobacteria bacterium]|nr:quinolinate synthase NadA [Actinomycetota bacterium]